MNWDELHNFTKEFSDKTDGLLHGTISPVDRLAARCKCPCHPSVSDPGSYFCRKGFHCLNVQACCDIQKHFLLVAPISKGTTHDFVAFTDSALCDSLMLMKEMFYDHKLHMIGEFNHTSRIGIFRRILLFRIR